MCFQINPNAHIWGLYVQTTNPTCIANGIKTRICNLCSITDIETEVGENKLGHNFEWEINIESISKIACTRCPEKNNGKVGDIGPGGGIIFYIDTNGFLMSDDNSIAYYLEVAQSEEDLKFKWVSPTYMPDLPANDPLLWDNNYWVNFGIEGTEDAIGTGRKNTALILSNDNMAPAARYCFLNGEPNDWFLPSGQELLELYYAKDFINNLVTTENSFYFCSTQAYNNTAPSINFYNGSIAITIKWTERYVRPIRAF